MDLQTALLNEHSKANTEAICLWIGNKQERFDQLMDLFLGEEARMVQRASWVVGKTAESHPGLILPHLSSVLDVMECPIHDAVLRNSLRILAELDIPEQHMGRVATISFDLLAAPKSAVAVKVFAMQVLANLCEYEPDLADELKLLIEDQWDDSSPGFRARGRRVLRQLEKRSGR